MKDLIGNIKVYKKTTSQRVVRATGNWFDAEYYQITIDEYCISFKKCYLEIPKGSLKISSIGSFTISCELPLGEYKVDEDSTEDELIFLINN